jgi:hypothetical protein
MDFNVPAAVAAADPVYLNLNSMKAGCEIILNDSLLGCAVFPGISFGVTGLLKEKENKLVIRVANTWRNRIIGDLTQFGMLKNCWTTSPASSLPEKGMPLSESGILGPLVFLY